MRADQTVLQYSVCAGVECSRIIVAGEMHANLCGAAPLACLFYVEEILDKLPTAPTAVVQHPDGVAFAQQPTS